MRLSDLKVLIRLADFAYFSAKVRITFSYNADVYMFDLLTILLLVIELSILSRFLTLTKLGGQ